MVQKLAARSSAHGDRDRRSDGERGKRSRGTRRKREILRAAARAFRRGGLHAVGMRDIAAKAGMHVGNLYYYFENKQEILAFCQQETLDALLQGVQEIDRQPLDAAGKLYLLIRSHVQCLNEDTPGSLAHLEVEALDADRRQPIQERRDRYEGHFRTLLQEGIEAGIFRPVHPKTAILAILGAANWTVKWFRTDGGRTASAIGEDFAELLVRGLLAEGVELEIPAPACEEDPP